MTDDRGVEVLRGVDRTRARRQALRGRSFLVRQRTVFKNRVHAYLTAENLHCPTVDLYGKGGRAWLETVELPRVGRYHVPLLLANIYQLTTQIRALDRDLSRTLPHDAVSQRLQTIPGVGPLGALILQAELLYLLRRCCFRWFPPRERERNPSNP